MRIGIIAHLKHPIAEPFAGGIEMHTHMLASKLKERGNDVVVFASSESKVSGLVPVCSATARSLAADEAPFCIHAKEQSSYLAIMNQLEQGRFDIVHNNSLHYLPLRMAKSLTVPMLTVLHTPPFDPLEEAVLAAGDQHHFVAVSEAVAKQWSKLTTVRDVISNGVDLSQFSYHAEPAANPYCVWYGRIVPEKGLHFAIDAARIAGLPLRFAGPILDSDYFSNFISLRLTSDTVYEGHLTHGKLSQLIGGARLFLCTPCWDEPYGLVVAEALASGVPVAAFARGAIPQILSVASGVLAKPDDSASLARAALQAFKLSRADCRTRAEQICDAEVMIDRYVDLYTSMMLREPAFNTFALSTARPACAS